MNDEGIRLYRHMLAALSENMCPHCLRPLGGSTECHGPGHHPVAFHLCESSDMAEPGHPAVVQSYRLSPDDDFWPCSNCGYAPA